MASGARRTSSEQVRRWRGGWSFALPSSILAPSFPPPLSPCLISLSTLLYVKHVHILLSLKLKVLKGLQSEPVGGIRLLRGTRGARRLTGWRPAPILTCVLAAPPPPPPLVLALGHPSWSSLGVPVGSDMLPWQSSESPTRRKWSHVCTRFPSLKPLPPICLSVHLGVRPFSQ